MHQPTRRLWINPWTTTSGLVREFPLDTADSAQVSSNRRHRVRSHGYRGRTLRVTSPVASVWPNTIVLRRDGGIRTPGLHLIFEHLHWL